MKKIFVSLVILALSIVGTLGAQKFSSLPIGYNLDGYISSVWVVVGPMDKKPLSEIYRFNFPQDGKLESFVSFKIREMAQRLPPPTGTENAQAGWYAEALTEGVGGLLPHYYGESKPATIATAPISGADKLFTFLNRNGKWEVPEEVFGKVKFNFGVSVGFYIPTANNIEVTMSNGSRISRFSTIEQVSDADNPCELPAILSAIRSGWAVGLPSVLLKPNGTEWWNRAEITLYEGDKQVTFVQNNPPSLEDGKAIRWSNPPPSFFTPPLPKITSLKRVFGEVTEIVVEGTPNSFVAVEWSEVLGGEWQTLSALVVPLGLNANGRGILTHKTKAAVGFYRLRLSDGVR